MINSPLMNNVLLAASCLPRRVCASKQGHPNSFGVKGLTGSAVVHRVRHCEALSRILRHKAVALGIRIRDDGFCPLEAARRLCGGNARSRGSRGTARDVHVILGNSTTSTTTASTQTTTTTTTTSATTITTIPVQLLER